MVVRHTRRQHPVGQGFFHSAECRDVGAGRSVFRYVYDCGAKQAYAAARDAAIDGFLRYPAPLDILFLSHAHDDHVLGVPRLIAGNMPNTVVMPLISPEERLLAFVSAALDDLTVATDPFYVAFTADPVQALLERGVRHVVQVRPGRGGAPGADGEPPQPMEGGEPASGQPRDRKWHFAGRGHPARIRVKVHASGKTSTSAPDDCALMLRGWAGVNWLWAMYVDPGVISQREDFLAELLGAGLTRPDLRDPAKILDLVCNRLPLLQRAYKKVKSDLNLTSLCLYSGPIRAQDRTVAHTLLVGERRTRHRRNAGRAAWLGTGDADLRSSKRRDAFLRHFGGLLDRVETMTLPHHGSSENFDAALLVRIRPELCVAAADNYSTWNHPGSRVVQAVASAGIHLAVVTSDPRSTLTEGYWVE